MSSGEQRVAAEKSGKKTGRCQGMIVEFPQYGSVGLQSPPQGKLTRCCEKMVRHRGKLCWTSSRRGRILWVQANAGWTCGGCRAKSSRDSDAKGGGGAIR